MLTVQSVQADVAGHTSYTDVAYDDVAVSDWQIWLNRLFDMWHHFGLWYGATWPSHGLPRGTVVLVVGLFQNFMESVGVEPWTSPWCKALAMAALPTRHTVFLINYMICKFI
jgi:hypothetical protein